MGRDQRGSERTLRPSCPGMVWTKSGGFWASLPFICKLRGLGKMIF